MSGTDLADWQKVDAALSEMGYPGCAMPPRYEWSDLRVRADVPRDVRWKAREVVRAGHALCLACYLRQAVLHIDMGETDAAVQVRDGCLATRRLTDDCGVDCP